MTTEPIIEDGPFPDKVNCPLHANALSEIKKIVLETRDEVRNLTSMDGPIARLNHEVDVVKTSVGRAHIDITEVRGQVRKVKEAQTSLIVKVGAIMAPVAAAIAAWVATLMGR